MLLSPAAAPVISPIPVPVFQISPAAPPSIAPWAELPPSPENLKDPKASEEIVTEWPSNGDVALATLVPADWSSPWSNVNDNATFRPLSNSPERANVMSFPMLKLFPVPGSLEPVIFLTLKLAPPLTVSAPANAEVVTSEAANAVKPIFFKLFIFFLCLFLFVINNKHSFYIQILPIFF